MSRNERLILMDIVYGGLALIAGMGLLLWVLANILVLEIDAKLACFLPGMY